MLSEQAGHGARYRLGHSLHGGKEQFLFDSHVTAECLIQSGEMSIRFGQRSDAQEVLQFGQQTVDVRVVRP